MYDVYVHFSNQCIDVLFKFVVYFLKVAAVVACSSSPFDNSSFMQNWSLLVNLRAAILVYGYEWIVPFY